MSGFDDDLLDFSRPFTTTIAPSSSSSSSATRTSAVRNKHTSSRLQDVFPSPPAPTTSDPWGADFDTTFSAFNQSSSSASFSADPPFAFDSSSRPNQPGNPAFFNDSVISQPQQDVSDSESLDAEDEEEYKIAATTPQLSSSSSQPTATAQLAAVLSTIQSVASSAMSPSANSDPNALINHPGVQTLLSSARLSLDYSKQAVDGAVDLSRRGMTQLMPVLVAAANATAQASAETIAVGVPVVSQAMSDLQAHIQASALPACVLQAKAVQRWLAQRVHLSLPSPVAPAGGGAGRNGKEELGGYIEYIEQALKQQEDLEASQEQARSNSMNASGASPSTESAYLSGQPLLLMENHFGSLNEKEKAKLEEFLVDLKRVRSQQQLLDGNQRVNQELKQVFMQHEQQKHRQLQQQYQQQPHQAQAHYESDAGLAAALGLSETQHNDSHFISGPLSHGVVGPSSTSSSAAASPAFISNYASTHASPAPISHQYSASSVTASPFIHAAHQSPNFHSTQQFGSHHPHAASFSASNGRNSAAASPSMVGLAQPHLYERSLSGHNLMQLEQNSQLQRPYSQSSILQQLSGNSSQSSLAAPSPPLSASPAATLSISVRTASTSPPMQQSYFDSSAAVNGNFANSAAPITSHFNANAQPSSTVNNFINRQQAAEPASTQSLFDILSTPVPDLLVPAPPATATNTRLGGNTAAEVLAAVQVKSNSKSKKLQQQENKEEEELKSSEPTKKPAASPTPAQPSPPIVAAPADASVPVAPPLVIVTSDDSVPVPPPLGAAPDAPPMAPSLAAGGAPTAPGVGGDAFALKQPKPSVPLKHVHWHKLKQSHIKNTVFEDIHSDSLRVVDAGAAPRVSPSMASSSPLIPPVAPPLVDESTGLDSTSSSSSSGIPDAPPMAPPLFAPSSSPEAPPLTITESPSLKPANSGSSSSSSGVSQCLAAIEIDLNIQDLEDKFYSGKKRNAAGAAESDGKSNAGASSSTSAGAAGNAKKKDEKDTKSVSLPSGIDTLRAYNAEISVSRLKMQPDQIRDCLLLKQSQASDPNAKGNEALSNQLVSSVDRLEILCKVVPTDEECAIVVNTQRDPDQLQHLHVIEAFFRALTPAVPRVRRRTELLLFKLEHAALHKHLLETIALVETAATELKSSSSLRYVLKLTLTVGNFLNATTAFGSAYGFKLDFLAKLNATKTSDNSMSLMHWLILEVQRQREKFLQQNNDASSGDNESKEDVNNLSLIAPPSEGQLLSELSQVQAAAAIDSAALTASLQSIKSNLSSIGHEIAACDRKQQSASSSNESEEDNFSLFMRDFHTSALADYEQLQARYQAVLSNCEELASVKFNIRDRYFAENESIKFEHLFSIFSAFLSAYERAEADVKRQRETKEAAEQKRLAQEAKRNAANSTSTISPASRSNAAASIEPSSSSESSDATLAPAALSSNSNTSSPMMTFVAAPGGPVAHSSSRVALPAASIVPSESASSTSSTTRSRSSSSATPPVADESTGSTTTSSAISVSTAASSTSSSSISSHTPTRVSTSSLLTSTSSASSKSRRKSSKIAIQEMPLE